MFGIGNKGKIVAKELNNSEDINFLGFAVSKRYGDDSERKDYLLAHPVRIG
ncbi:hypothetical protein [Pseudobutyrivibrio sp. ACV-2]|uniref:hypothetical protein n=1 Tax=Pseudobutyrivibrio sp. ACV-2 TaxID=1520801 RepID=UPI00147E81E7|nr:hypothetical protein [Pseudobutyrivibrio sp. ACV-2]